MDLFKEDAIEHISLKISEIFNQGVLESLARSTSFIERTSSRLTGSSFALLNIMDWKNAQESSLQDLCDILEEKEGIKLSKQSLDERYNTFSVAFMKALYGKLVKAITEEERLSQLSCHFSEIGISDSTSFNLPARLRVFYPGSGTKSGAKIFYDYDLLKGQFKDLLVVGGNENDASYLDKIEDKIKINGLYIKDLGFYQRNHFMAIHQRGAYFLSRSKSTSTYYIPKGNGKWEKIGVHKLLEGVDKKCEKEVYLNKGPQAIKVRLIIDPVSPEVAQKRMVKATMKTKSNGYKISDKTRISSGYSVFITNVPTAIMPQNLIMEMYFLRWQIEIIFKTWKSIFCIDKIRPMSIFRFECYLYSCLINVVLSMATHQISQSKVGMELEISIWKAAKIFSAKIKKLKKAILKGLDAIIKFLRSVVDKTIKFGLKSSKKQSDEGQKRRPFEVIRCLGNP